MKKFASRGTAAMLALLFTWMLPVIAFASSSSSDDDAVTRDARMENYTAKVDLGGGNTALMWFLVALLAALCVGVMFKSANRSHLD